MEALRASYGDASSDSDSDESSPADVAGIIGKTKSGCVETTFDPLPPPPLSLLNPSSFVVTPDFLSTELVPRVRNFPHVEGNYALHVYIPVSIPLAPKKEMARFLKRIVSLVPGLHLVDADIPLSPLYQDDQKLQQVVLGRKFHISLGRTVPIRVHQIDSVVSMLRQKLQSQKPYWIDFNKWEVFVNDDCTRSFLSIEVLKGGLAEITKQIEAVNEVYKLHNLPEFYKNPRPHISLAWALGDISTSLKRVVEDEMRRHAAGVSSQARIFTCKFAGIECKIGNKTHKICKVADE